MKKYFIINSFLFLFYLSDLLAERFISNESLWKHVVTLDRLTWEERQGIKKINKKISDEHFVRRIYLDITGKIPTYDQMLAFRKSKLINKRQVLIQTLLDSSGYVSHFSNFWLDLLRNPYQDPEGFHQKEFTRYVERFLYENKSYDKIVYDFITANGMLQQNPSVGFFIRDKDTGTMDTTNAMVRAFLGTRIGCAQCHNHRFDKWTQKDFYETAAYFHGIHYYESFPSINEVFDYHKSQLKNDSRYHNSLFSAYSNYFLRPSGGAIYFKENEKLRYPQNYVYDNAKPNSEVKERIVFNYGEQTPKGKNRREVLANWMTSKHNPMFSRVMANRLWKRIIGVANMSPIDDWKDHHEIQNPRLFKALGNIFSELDYDIKALLSVIFNSEAYQYGISLDNKFDQDDYKAQGAVLKRMSAQQLNDSLLTLQFGDIDQNTKISSEYFTCEDQINELVTKYIHKLKPMLDEYYGKYGGDPSKYTEADQKIMDCIYDHLIKLKEIKEYHYIGDNGYLKQVNLSTTSSKRSKKQPKNSVVPLSMMQNMGSMKQNSSKIRTIHRSHQYNNDFMSVFGSNDRSTPETEIETEATMKQILKMMNSQHCINVTKSNSNLMIHTMALKKLNERVSYLYYSIFGRAPTSKEFRIAKAFFEKGHHQERWSKYVLALLNSPEFYFIK